MKLRAWSFPRLKRDETEKRPIESDRLRAVNVTRGTELTTNAEVARSGGKRSKGLLGRKGLAPGEGLWIVPCEAIHTFFMQFDIDLIYLDRKHRIKKVASGIHPWRISACLSAYSVLELPSGTVRKSQSRPGDMVEFSPPPAGLTNSPGCLQSLGMSKTGLENDIQ